MIERPNFLFFITDQLRADHLGSYGNRTIRTPTVDSLAARGVSFDRFYVASPVCQSNRATLMTGRMPSLHGVRYNGISLSLAANTFVDLMRAGGWRTALIGKSHLQNMTGMPTVVENPPLPQGFQPPPAGLDEALKEDHPDEAYEQENGREWDRNPARSFRLPYYGFDHVELCSGHAVEVHGSYTGWLRERRPDADRLRGPENALPGNTYSLPQAWRTAMPEELYPTSYVVERTLAYLDAHAGPQRRVAVLPAVLVSRSASSLHPARPLLGHVQAGRRGIAGRVSDGQSPAAAACGGAARRARRRDPQGRQPGSLRRQRAGDPRGNRAHLRHDRDDRRWHGEDPQTPRRTRPRRKHSASSSPATTAT